MSSIASSSVYRMTLPLPQSLPLHRLEVGWTAPSSRPSCVILSAALTHHNTRSIGRSNKTKTIWKIPKLVVLRVCGCAPPAPAHHGPPGAPPVPVGATSTGQGDNKQTQLFYFTFLLSLTPCPGTGREEGWGAPLPWQRLEGALLASGKLQSSTAYTPKVYPLLLVWKNICFIKILCKTCFVGVLQKRGTHSKRFK